MQAILTVACALTGVAVVAMVTAAGLLGWAGHIGRWQRIGLSLMAGGLAWGGIGRSLGKPPGVGDLLFLAGLGLYLWLAHGRAIKQTVDGLDGAVDGRIGRGKA